MLSEIWGIFGLAVKDIGHGFPISTTNARVTLGWLDNFVTKYLRDSTFEHGREWALLKSALRLDWSTIFKSYSCMFQSRNCRGAFFSI